MKRIWAAAKRWYIISGAAAVAAVIAAGMILRHSWSFGDVPTWILAVTTMAALAGAIVATKIARDLYVIESARDRAAAEDRRLAAEDRKRSDDERAERRAADQRAQAAADQERAERRDADQRAQANKVAAWFGFTRQPGPSGAITTWGGFIRNASELPILDVRTIFYFVANPRNGQPWEPDYRGEPADVIRVIPPGETRFVEMAEAIRQGIKEIPKATMWPVSSSPTLEAAAGSGTGGARSNRSDDSLMQARCCRQAPGLERSASVPRMNPIVEAAWIAAAATSVAVTATVVVAISGARNTRKATESTIQAERRLRLMERRADAYQDALADLLARQAERDKKLYPVKIDDAGNIYSTDLPAYEPEGWFDKLGRLITYCSASVRQAYELSAAADSQLATLYRERQSLTERATRIEADPDDHLASISIDLAISDLQGRTLVAWIDAGAKDIQLIDAIRAELSPDPPGRASGVWAGTLGPPNPDQNPEVIG